MIIEIVEALKTRCVSQFTGRVAGAAEYQQLDPAAKMTLPAAYVIPLDDSAEPNTSDNGYTQVIRDNFAVIVVLSNTVDEIGKASISQVIPARNALFSALLAWSPDDEHGPIEYEGGNLLSIDRARMYYQFEFSCETQIGEADTYQGAANALLPDFTQVGVKVDLIDPSLTGEPDGDYEAVIQIDVPQT